MDRGVPLLSENFVTESKWDNLKEMISKHELVPTVSKVRKTWQMVVGNDLHTKRNDIELKTFPQRKDLYYFDFIFMLKAKVKQVWILKFYVT